MPLHSNVFKEKTTCQWDAVDGTTLQRAAPGCQPPLLPLVTCGPRISGKKALWTSLGCVTEDLTRLSPWFQALLQMWVNRQGIQKNLNSSQQSVGPADLPGKSERIQVIV